jgi:hypothetical protein
MRFHEFYLLQSRRVEATHNATAALMTSPQRRISYSRAVEEDKKIKR